MGRDWISVPLGRGVRVGHSWGTGYGYGSPGGALMGAVLGFLLFLFIGFWVAVIFTVFLFMRGLWHIFSGRIMLGLFWIAISCGGGYVEAQLYDAWEHPPETTQTGR